MQTQGITAMMPTEALLDQLTEQVRQLTDAHAAAREALLKARQESEKLQSDLKTVRGQLANFQKQAKFNTIATTLAAEGTDADMLRTQLDAYMKEIDACIAYLQQQ